MHGDVVYCVAMLCNYRRPLVPKPLTNKDAEVEEQQPEGLSDVEINENDFENEFEVTDREGDETDD